MKIPAQFLAMVVVIILSSTSVMRGQDAPPPPPPDDQGQAAQGDDQSASFQTFYDQLGDQGTWVQTDDYGYVFQPNVTDPNWAPYSDGHWVYTDVGWTWVSDEPWGWATYHYGRWANIDGTGWVWIPGYQWAPAWVSWRYGGGYCGWAPLPPESFIGAEYGDGGVSVGFGFHFGGDVDTNFNIGPGCYNFVAVGDMGERNYRGHYLDRSRNYSIINNTRNITNINITRNRAGADAAFHGVSVGGPTLTEVNAHAREHVQTVQLTAANQAGRGSLQGNTLAVYAPRVNPATIHQAKPANVGQAIAHPTFNRGDSITKPLAVTATVRPVAPSAEAIQAAKTAQLHAPAKAKIATEQTTIRTPLNKPLTSMEPVAPTHKTATAASPAASSLNQHPSASSAFTGEPANKPESTYHPQTEAAPATTYHPQAEQKPAATYHPQSAPAPTYHPQTEEKPAATYHPETAPAPTYHPQAEQKPAATYHPENAPAPTYHPQVEQKPVETFHPQSAPTPAYHPEPQVSHEAAPQVHQQAAPAPASHPAAAPAAAPAKPAPASGNNQNQQNH